MVLLVGAGLMLRSFDRMRTIPLGYDPNNAIAIDLDLPSRRYQAPESREQFIKQVEERIRQLPGVISVGTTRALPLESGGPDSEFGIHSKPHVEGQPWPSAFYTAVTPGYFRAMGMTMARGRGFVDTDDHPTADRVVVINETAARRYWGRLLMVDSTGQSLTYGRALAGALLFAKAIDTRARDQRMVGIMLPASVGGALAIIATHLAGRIPVNLNFTAGADAVSAAI